MKRKYSVSTIGPCAVCGSTRTDLYEDKKDGAMVIACCKDHAEKAFATEDKAARKEVASFIQGYHQNATALCD